MTHRTDTSLTSVIDHTLLRADADEKDVRRLCREARRFKCAAVCVNPLFVAAAKMALRGSPVRVCTVVGFPLGATTTAVKVFEAREAVRRGADEIDAVIPVGLAKQGSFDRIAREVRALRAAARGKTLKIIIETAFLTDGEKRKLCRIVREAGADFIKTSTGYGPGGATVDDVRLLRFCAGPRMGVKASGGIRSLADLRKMVAAGASRVGTSSLKKIVAES